MFCATSAWMARIPAATSMATINRQTKTPPALIIFEEIGNEKEEEESKEMAVCWNENKKEIRKGYEELRERKDV